ncbi:MAG: hypothetical protein JWQ55_172 [Rhodopila sp.]|jgi:Protein of unknown function (DUF1264)|nr:hypothetical protein [Rhodopila sp.]
MICNLGLIGCAADRSYNHLISFILRLSVRFCTDRVVTPCSSRGLLGTISLGVTAGVVAATAALLGRKLGSAAAVGKGDPLKHRALDLASGVLQRKYPVEAMSTYLNGFHFYADDMGRQVEASHFCIHLRHDLHQWVIFDSNKPDARLIGIEYIVSAERFRSLPDDEKQLWHSHHYEVKSGVLIAPGIPELLPASGAASSIHQVRQPRRRRPT